MDPSEQPEKELQRPDEPSRATSHASPAMDGLTPVMTLRDLERVESGAINVALVGSMSPEEPIEAVEHGQDLEKTSTNASKSGETLKKVTTAQNWTGPDDPGNPMNWPLPKRAYHTAAIGALACYVTTASSLITPATEEIAVHFHVSLTASILTLTLYVVGLAMGPMLAAPVSEVFGRKIVYVVTPPISMLFLVGAGLSKSFGSLLVCRLLSGIAGSPVLAVGAGSTADMYPTHHRAVATAIFVMMPFLGPSIGPVIGGFVAQYKGWRWTQYVTIFVGIVAYIMVLFTQETYKKIILMRRAKKLGVPGPPKPALTPLQLAKVLITVTLFRPIRMLLTEPIVLFLSIYNAFTFSILFAFFAAFPYVFAKQYHFNTFQSGLVFIGVLIGVLFAVVMVILIDRLVYYRIYYHRALAAGKMAAPPEHRLYAAMAGSFGIPIGVFWFGWTARPSIHWISPILSGIPFAWGNTAIFMSAGLYLLDVYGPMNGASALAANGILRYTLAGTFPLFTIQMYEYLHITYASTLLALLSVLMIPIPFVLFKYGEKIRARSGYETTKF